MNEGVIERVRRHRREQEAYAASAPKCPFGDDLCPVPGKTHNGACETHHGWRRSSCVPCRDAPYGDRSFKDPMRLDKKERECLFVQTGVRFESKSKFYAWCKANGKRPSIEKGEPQDVTRREMDEWHAGGESGPPPHSLGQGRRKMREEKFERVREEVLREMAQSGEP